MVNVEELFAMLGAGEKPGTGTLRAQSTAVVSEDGPLVAAVDDAGRRHLLVPAGGRSVSPDVRSRGVRITSRVLERDGQGVRYADLECCEQRLTLVFDRLAADVLRRVEEAPGQALHVVYKTLDQWRELLRSAGTVVDRDTVLGLTGELEVLGHVGADNPSRALDAWYGPHMSPHDFCFGGRALEVKSTASVDGNIVQLSNIDQLDPVDLAALHLAVVHCRELDTAPSLDERIRDLVRKGFPEGRLVDAVRAGGYVFESGGPELQRFHVRSVRIWPVGPNFPGLRRSDIREGRLNGVGRIKYELALDSAPPPLHKDSTAPFLRGWLSDA